ncbi:MAG: hypothetical protein AB8B62_19630 [Roseobacter sp.]
MGISTDIVLIVGSGPNAPDAAEWPRAWFDRIVVINNAWRVRTDWDDLVYPEDFPEGRRPDKVGPDQRLITADQFVPTQNAFGGFVYGGGTMAFTAGYWALHALRPKVMAFIGCDMVYPKSGPTHFYGTGAADPLRDDITLRDLGAKSARLGLIAANEGCHCVNLSNGPSELLFDRAQPRHLRGLADQKISAPGISSVLNAEDNTGYFVPNGRYWDQASMFDTEILSQLDSAWRAAWPVAQDAIHAA